MTTLGRGKPYDDCVGHMHGHWVRALKEQRRVAFGIDHILTPDEARELARLLIMAAEDVERMS